MTKQKFRSKSLSELQFTAQDIAGVNLPNFPKNVSGGNVSHKI